MPLPYSSLQLPLVNRTIIQIINIYDILVFYVKTKKGAIYSIFVVVSCCLLSLYIYLLFMLFFLSFNSKKIPSKKDEAKSQGLVKNHQLVKSQDNVPENLQLQFLSICLGAKSGSVGLATWHDFDPAQRVHESFKRLAVIGSLWWILVIGWMERKRKIEGG